MRSISGESDSYWIERRMPLLNRFVRQFPRLDRGYLTELIFSSPSESRRLLENINLTQNQKVDRMLSFVINSPQLTCCVMGDQRSGKDGTLTAIFELCIFYCTLNGLKPPRIVTLGNIQRPPFVDEDDMYFSFKDIPAGSKDQEVWIYCSEIETVLPSREGSSAENRLFSQLEGTMAQNHQKLFGVVKLLAKVDLNFIRSLNLKIFKFISPEKLLIENVERGNVLTPLGKLLLPNDFYNKSQTLVTFELNMYEISFSLPEWWTQEYSEQYANVPFEKIVEFCLASFESNTKPHIFETSVFQKFRYKLTEEELDHIYSKF